MDEREKLLEQIMAYDFVMTDLNLYLNTHPSDENALKDYRACLEESDKLRSTYTKKYGPLSPRYFPEKCWTWIDDPWPWECS